MYNLLKIYLKPTVNLNKYLCYIDQDLGDKRHYIIYRNINYKNAFKKSDYYDLILKIIF